MLPLPQRSTLFPYTTLFRSRTVLRKDLNTNITSSAGRLFDAIAAISGVCQKANFEGQAAMELEFAIDGIETDDRYLFEDRKSTRLNSSHSSISYAVFCLKKK